VRDGPAPPDGTPSEVTGGTARAVRTRFAPSPNGPLHIGHARTGVFNWILARQCGGQYFVRFERTDRPREAPGARASMMEDLGWLGLLGDEEPHDQVDLADHHRGALNRLVEGGYTCADGDAVRFRVPAEGSVDWDDLVCGPVVVANEDLDDPVLVRSSGAPTFFLASTADDIHDGVSDVIRPDVLLRASAKQLHIWEALGHRPPRIGHHPLMKRSGGQNVTAVTGDGSVRRLREAGIHPTALVAYLAMPQVASWKTTPVRLVEEVIERFDPRRVSRRPMAFDIRALEILNRRLAGGGRQRS